MPEHRELDIQEQRRKSLSILTGLWVAIAIILFLFHSVLLPFASAALIAYLVHPLVTRMTRVRVRGHAIPRWVGILIIYTLFFVAIYLFFIAMVPQLYGELARVSRDGVAFVNSLTPERIHLLADHVEDWLRDRGIPVAIATPEEIRSGVPAHGLLVDLEKIIQDGAVQVRELVRQHLGDIVTISRGIITSVLAGVFMMFFMLMVAAFLSIDAHAIVAYVTSLLPAEYGTDSQRLLERIDRSLSGVVRGQVTICLVNGALTFVGLLLFGVKFAFLLATVATVFSLIPIFGTILSSVPIVLIALADGVQKGFLILLWIIGIHALEAYFLNPKIMGSAARIHPVIVAFSLIAGEKMFGLVGALFAVPVASIVVACFDYARLKAQPAQSAALELPGASE
ncbi:AI-2E family transporter [Melittangium boletus]|uniref:AI-2E family transporter n=1 Tax=Melittangium boletus DSM 14713 TaxID=1294270 RepID=A0A250I7U6_9BACT|nr:AI-2E family transporter [Melittangium boletus]ATB27845.1 AI-2E family transporter [Melittangium boletus DSM 14713]